MDGNILRIDFSDTGSGIKREILEDIFLDFVTTKASSVGVGQVEDRDAEPFRWN